MRANESQNLRFFRGLGLLQYQIDTDLKFVKMLACQSLHFIYRTALKRAILTLSKKPSAIYYGSGNISCPIILCK